MDCSPRLHIITNFIITIISGNIARKCASPGSEVALGLPTLTNFNKGHCD